LESYVVKRNANYRPIKRRKGPWVDRQVRDVLRIKGGVGNEKEGETKKVFANRPQGRKRHRSTFFWRRTRPLG